MGKEIETEVKEFNRAYKILSNLDFKAQYYQENRRAAYQLGEI